MGFKIPWKLISIGLWGCDEIPALLNREEVLDYIDILLTNANYFNDQINDSIALFCEKEDSEKFDRLLKKIAGKDKSDAIIQKRKWRVFLLKTLLDSIGEDYFQGLLGLTQFWITMGSPSECPLVFPPSGDKKKIQEYFTKTSCDLYVEKSREWLSKEILAIIAVET